MAEDPLPTTKAIKQMQGAYNRLTKVAKAQPLLVTPEMQNAVEQAGKELGDTIQATRAKKEADMDPADLVARKTRVLQSMQAKAKALEKEREEAASHLKEAEEWAKEVEERHQEMQGKIEELEQEKIQAEARQAAKGAEEELNRAPQQPKAEQGSWSQEEWGIDNPSPASMVAALRYLSENWAGVNSEDGELLQAVNKVLDKQEAKTQALGAKTLKGKGKGRRPSPGESESEQEEEDRARTRSPRTRWGNNAQ